MKYDFIISGAGISGLTTAIALQQEGYHVKVLERNKELKEVGAGIGIGPNAWKALDELGIVETLAPYCNGINNTHFVDSKGKILSNFKMRRITEKYGVASFAIHRADLLNVLISHLNPGTLELEKKVVDYEQYYDGVHVFLEDGDTLRGNALIAADGIHSPIRQKCLPKAKPRYSGYTCWRVVMKVTNYESFKNDLYIETWGEKGRFGIIPLKANQIYWYACVNAPFQSEKMSAFTTKDLLEMFQNYHLPIPELIKETRDDVLIHNDIIDLKPIKQFAFNRVLLIGDAAHATTPNLGQGASQAITDAIVLGKILKTTNNLESAFKAFEKKRISKTNKVIYLSWLLGIAAQLNNRLLISLRNIAMRLLPSWIPEKQLESIYDTD